VVTVAAETRFGGDSKTADMQMRVLTQVLDHLLKKAGLEEGKVVLDVGAGEGLIGFGALELVGTTGRVIFSDISQALLEFDRSAAEQMGVLDRCSLVKAAAEDLSAIESESVDVVTTRSVLIYVDDKPKAFREFFRVLKAGREDGSVRADRRSANERVFRILAKKGLGRS
jgi:arsenite methyltransferase